MLNHAKIIAPFEHVYKIESSDGYIVWRMGTGDTTELLEIWANGMREGRGTCLLKLMLEQISTHTVYGFCRASNQIAFEFYLKRGFNVQPLPRYYEEGAAVFFYQSCSVLRETQ